MPAFVHCTDSISLLYVFNFLEKGFCMKGDLCPYDHGTDAVILDDVSLTTAVTQSGAPKTDTILPTLTSTVVPPQHLVPPALPLRLPFPPPPVSRS